LQTPPSLAFSLFRHQARNDGRVERAKHHSPLALVSAPLSISLRVLSRYLVSPFRRCLMTRLVPRCNPLP
jgi:hypothetical protein